MAKLKQVTINGQDFFISSQPSDQEMEWIFDCVEADKWLKTNGEINQPGVEISVVLRDVSGNVQGGVIASTVCRVMHLEVLWVAEQHRRMGYGAELVLTAERIGLVHGCNTSQTWTFSFQGPQFYPSIGYQLLGVYDGYPDGITEHVFMKKLSEPSSIIRNIGTPDSRGFYLDKNIIEKETKILHEGLRQHVQLYVGERHRGPKVRLVVKDENGELIGGLSAWTTLQNLIFEYIWVEESFRGKGIGKTLMAEMERIARENGCIASQAQCFSFQAIGFFEKTGYKILGISDGYPAPIKEFYLIKKYCQSPD